jgi:hypothetical protein
MNWRYNLLHHRWELWVTFKKVSILAGWIMDEAVCEETKFMFALRVLDEIQAGGYLWAQAM